MPRRPGPGQPTKLTPEVQERILSAIRAGNYFITAAKYGGVDNSTFQNWMLWGQQGKSALYVEFFEAVKKAEADSEAALVAAWRKHGPENWQAAAALLERRFPERWARRNPDNLKKLSLEEQKLQAEIELLKTKQAELQAGMGSHSGETINVGVMSFPLSDEDKED